MSRRVYNLREGVRFIPTKNRENPVFEMPEYINQYLKSKKAARFAMIFLISFYFI